MRTESIQTLNFSSKLPTLFKFRSTTVGRKIIIAWLQSFSVGRLTVIDESAPEGEKILHFGQSEMNAELTATLHVHNPECYWNIINNGTLGAGESYMQGHWSADDLTHVVQLMVANMEALDSLDKSKNWLQKGANQLLRFVNANSIIGSKRNISAHYDLGNDFFSLFLDPTMMYSAAIYQNEEQSLHTASVHKLDRVCDKLQLCSDDHLLEIGTGWGGLAIHAAQNYGCKVTTTTLSQEQFDMATANVKALGLENKVTIIMEDYRDLTGQYDKLVSIEMIEAVGHEFLPSYFKQCSDLLKKDGLMLIQAITIADQRYHAYRKSVDFIQKYIFPGGCLPSTEIISKHLSKHTDMQMVHLEDITKHYATTLKDWREAFFDNIDAVRDQGYPEEFIRMWEYYLCYCEGGFLQRTIQTGQYVFAKPNHVELNHLNN